MSSSEVAADRRSSLVARTNADFVAAHEEYARAYPEEVAELAAKVAAGPEPASRPNEPAEQDGEWKKVWAPSVAVLELTPEAWEQVQRDVEAARQRVADNQEIIAEMNQLSEAQRARIRPLTENAKSRALLRRMAAARQRTPLPWRRPRGTLRGGARRRSVRTRPRRARAPASQNDDSESSLACPAETGRFRADVDRSREAVSR